ncbi:MAG: TIGR02117 family protein [Azonexus sp.]|nr:TIGR02117 family protein [Azonexus sp.]
MFVAACSGKPYVVEPAVSGEATRSTTVYVVSHGWHTGLVIPSEHMNAKIPELKQRFKEAAYYEIGWGDKGFYQATEITTGLALQAMFWSTGAILHVVAVPSNPREYFTGSKVVETCLTTSETVSLSTFIGNSFTRDAEGHIIRLGQGIYGDSQFYHGEGRYDMLNTCNNWTAKGLRSAGLNISPAWKFTAGSVMRSVEANRNSCLVNGGQELLYK